DRVASPVSCNDCSGRAFFPSLQDARTLVLSASVSSSTREGPVILNSPSATPPPPSRLLDQLRQVGRTAGHAEAAVTSFASWVCPNELRAVARCSWRCTWPGTEAGKHTRGCGWHGRNPLLFWTLSGEDGIRTRGGGLSPLTGLANRRYRPLSHLSLSP